MSLIQALVLSVTFLAPFVMTTPQVLFPVNSQFPPVARVFQYFNFSFSESTFASDGSPLQYNLPNAPPWLQFDGQARLFHGVPSIGDVGEVLLELFVADSTGFLVHDVKLIVSPLTAPSRGRDIGAQIRSTGKTDVLGGLILPQGQRFNFSFTKDTFYDRENVKRYSAVSSNNTPLPSWIQFDYERLQFCGKAPLLGSQDTPLHRYGLKLIAEDYINFEGSSATFEVAVNHHLAAVQREFKIDMTVGMMMFYRLQLAQILLDGKPIQKTHIRNITSSASEWLTFSSTEFALIGNSPFEPRSETVTITIQDIYDNEIKFNVTARAIPEEIFTIGLSNVSATKGKWFQYSLNSTIFSQSNLTVSAKFVPGVDWIFFDPDSLMFTGNVPQDASNIKVNITATSTITGYSESQIFEIQIIDSSTEGDDGKLNTSSNHQSMPSKKLKIILISTLLPVFGGLFILVCVTCRKQLCGKLKSRKLGQRSGTPTCDMISRPMHTNATSDPWPVATVPKKGPEYTPVVERGYTGPGFVGVAPVPKMHTKDNSAGSDLLMRVGAGGIGSAITTDDDPQQSGGSLVDIPRRLTSIPMLTKIVSGEPLKVPSASSSTDRGDNRNWASLATGSGESIPGEASTSSCRKSWRRTLMWAQRSGPRDSDATVDTVSTAEVFSVRLVGSPIMIGDRSEATQWQTRGMRKEELPKDRFKVSGDEEHKDKNEKHVYFGDDWEITDLPAPQQNYVPQPSSQAAQRSLQRYRDSRASLRSEPFEDFVFTPTPVSPITIPPQGNSILRALVQGKVRNIGSGLRVGERQKPKVVDLKKGEGVSKPEGKGSGWKF